MLKLANALLALLGGVAGTVALFWVLNLIVDALPQRWRPYLRPYAFIGPAVLVVGIFLIYPAIRTVVLSFFDDRSETFVGFANYADLALDPQLRNVIINNVLWVVVVPLLAVAFGLAVAVLADRLPRPLESGSKSVIFLPMAISAVGASTIWGFIYAWQPPGRPQIGVLNAIWTGLGNEPVSWLQVSNYRLNSFLLMVILIWGQAGFAMVLLSSAIKGVPGDTLEAAKVDGSSDWQSFWLVVVPQIRSSIVVVYTTILIVVLKVFDIVFVLTGGNFNTDVIANRFIIELFDFRRFGRGAAIVVFLMVATIPVMAFNIRQFREQESR